MAPVRNVIFTTKEALNQGLARSHSLFLLEVPGTRECSNRHHLEWMVKVGGDESLLTVLVQRSAVEYMGQE